ncbi:hypothetical protein [Roseibium alexandrii]|uniref:hypothetical protein n=1 Tax=Roseibium alexandrii TaxID=388408 RepID=UPI003751EAA3
MTPKLHATASTRPIAPMQMASGRIVDLARLTPKDVYWPDLVESLVKLPRFNGATPHVTYSTAQHCCLMHDRAEDGYKAKALLADFHCAYFGEISRSFRHFAAHLSGDPQGFLENFYLARDEVTATIWQAAGLREDNLDMLLTATANTLRDVDKRLTAAERRDLMTPCEDSTFWQLPAPYPVPVKAWGADKARAELELRLSMIGVFSRG